MNARPLAHPGPRCTLRDCARRSARPGGCTLNADGTAVKRSIGRQTRCNDRKLGKGPTATCDLTTPPGCAGTLVTDGVALAYGPNNPAGTAVDAHAVKAQLACQRRIGRGVSGYVGTKLRGLIRGKDPATLETKARRRSEERRVGKECRSRWSPYH